MAWGSTVFNGVAGLVKSFEARKVVLWLLETCQQSRTGWCCEATKTSQATPSVSFARLVLWVFVQLEMWRGADPNLRRSLEFAVSNLSPAWRQVPL